MKAKERRRIVRERFHKAKERVKAIAIISGLMDHRGLESTSLSPDKFTFNKPSYTYNYPLSPNIAFYKFLATCKGWPKLELNIPDTVIFNDTDYPIYLYTSRDGCVCRAEAINLESVKRRLSEKEPLDASAVIKTPKWSQVTDAYSACKVEVLSDLDMKFKLDHINIHGPFAIQKYIKSRGPVAFFLRVIYRKNSKSQAFIISNKNNFRNLKTSAQERCLVDVYKPSTYNVTSTYTGRFLDDTLPSCVKIANFLEQTLAAEVLELACDFLKDEEDVWWFVTCKAFKLSDQETPKLGLFLGDSHTIASPQRKKHDYERLKRCRLCQRSLPLHKLTHKLTIQMIIFADNHLKKRGINVKWLDRSEYRNTTHSLIYSNFSVCNSCYNLYEMSVELNEIEQLFSNVFSIENQTSSTDVTLNCPLKFFRVLFIINDIQEVTEEGQISMDFRFLGKEYSITSMLRPPVLPIQKFWMFQLFATSRSAVKQYIEQHPYFKVNLSNKNGSQTIDLEMIDFRNKIVKHKFYYKMMRIDNRNLGYLNCKLAITEEEVDIDISSIKLRPYGNMYVLDRLLCLPLPEEFLTILPDLYEYEKSVNENSGLSLNLSVKENTKSAALLGREKMVNDLLKISTSNIKLKETTQLFSFKLEVTDNEGNKHDLNVNVPPDYPLSPPLVKFENVISHPKIDKEGYLKTKKKRLPSIINLIQSLFSDKSVASERSTPLISNTSLPEFRLQKQKISKMIKDLSASRDSLRGMSHSPIAVPIQKRKLRPRDNIWSLSVHLTSGIKFPEANEMWTVSITALGQGIQGSEWRRTDNMVFFNCSFNVKIKGEKVDVLNALEEEKIAIYFYTQGMNSVCILDLNLFKDVSEIRNIYPVWFDEHESCINVFMSLTSDPYSPFTSPIRLSNGIYISLAKIL